MRTDVLYGLVSGLGVSLWILLEYALGLHGARIAIGEYSGYFSSLIPFFAIWLLVKRKQAEFGPMFNLRRGLWAGLQCALVGAIVVYVFLVIYNLYINPGWLDYALKWKVDQMRAAHVPEVDIRKEITFYRNANTPVGLLVSTLLGSTLFGGLMALFITLWVSWRAQRVS